MTTVNKYPKKICSRCILDETVPELQLDENNVCNYCHLHEVLEKQYPRGKAAKTALEKLLKQIKKDGKGKKYDCIVGVSGGTDSSYMLYQTTELGLRPLAVHFDNGWNSEIAVNNIKKVCTKLNVDLYTYVVDWEEFKNLQISFLKASVSDAEIPTDVGLHAALVQTAAKEKIKYVFNGRSFRNEGIAPIGWTYIEGKYIRSVQREYGDYKLKTFPNFTLFDLFYYNVLRGIKVIAFLNYFDYNKEKAKKLLANKFSWQYYGGNHHESIYTLFFQSFYLPKKFNIDKRKTELSACIRSEQITREEGLKKINGRAYKFDNEIVNYTISKLGLTKQEFEKIMKAKNKTFRDYHTYYPLLNKFKWSIKFAFKLGIIPEIYYYKYSILLG